jgi:hypothetical protein
MCKLRRKRYNSIGHTLLRSGIVLPQSQTLDEVEKPNPLAEKLERLPLASMVAVLALSKWVLKSRKNYFVFLKHTILA